ncbi:hypothetical protein PG985_006723 [Apiospora marii]|uniref:uncharacterized protein n=1 Tax=Apiospora marii TaxID=335849 RepID=UPI0031304994
MASSADRPASFLRGLLSTQRTTGQERNSQRGRTAVASTEFQLLTLCRLQQAQVAGWPESARQPSLRPPRQQGAPYIGTGTRTLAHLTNPLIYVVGTRVEELYTSLEGTPWPSSAALNRVPDRLDYIFVAMEDEGEVHRRYTPSTTLSINATSSASTQHHQHQRNIISINATSSASTQHHQHQRNIISINATSSASTQHHQHQRNIISINATSSASTQHHQHHQHGKSETPDKRNPDNNSPCKNNPDKKKPGKKKPGKKKPDKKNNPAKLH